MKTAFFLLLGVGLLFAANTVVTSAEPKTDLDKLQGSWLTVALVYDGKALFDEKNPPMVEPAKLAYDGSKWMVKADGKTIAFGITKLDPTKKPKEIDVFDESGTKNEKTKLGIYELDGDTFKYCLAPAGKPRPTEFVSKPGSEHSLIISKREKP
jgi:uncharacterized protein (TIGR03067 family)